MIEMKKEFLNQKLWRGKIPDIFEEYVKQIFELGFDDEVKPVNLLQSLMKLDFTFHGIEWNPLYKS